MKLSVNNWIFDYNLKFNWKSFEHSSQVFTTSWTTWNKRRHRDSDRYYVVCIFFLALLLLFIKVTEMVFSPGMWFVFLAANRFPHQQPAKANILIDRFPFDVKSAPNIIQTFTGRQRHEWLKNRILRMKINCEQCKRSLSEPMSIPISSVMWINERPKKSGEKKREKKNVSVHKASLCWWLCVCYVGPCAGDVSIFAVRAHSDTMFSLWRRCR